MAPPLEVAAFEGADRFRRSPVAFQTPVVLRSAAPPELDPLHDSPERPNGWRLCEERAARVPRGRGLAAGIAKYFAMRLSLSCRHISTVNI